MTWTYIKHVLLGTLIVLSLFLSIGLWSAGRRLSEPQSANESSAASSLMERTEAEVFSPYVVALHGVNEVGEIQLTTTNSLQNFIDQTLNEAEFERIDTRESLYLADYQENLVQGEKIEFLFSGQTPFGIWENAFTRSISDYDELTYNRIVIDLENLEQIEFYNTQEETVYYASVSSLTIEDFEAVRDTESLSYVGAESMEIGGGYVYLPIEALEIEHRNYTVERVPTNVYVNQFFTDTSEVDSRTTGNVTRLIDMTTEVQINAADHILTYESQQTALDELTLTERLNRSFSELQQVENWTEEVKFSSYAAETNEVVFQRYLEGLPVFSLQRQEALVKMAVNNNGLSELTLPLRIVQTPLDTGDETEVLQSGQELMSIIDASSIIERTDVEDIRLGLTWEESSENSRVVHFIPNWYVKIENTWYEIEQLVE